MEGGSGIGPSTDVSSAWLHTQNAVIRSSASFARKAISIALAQQEQSSNHHHQPFLLLSPPSSLPATSGTSTNHIGNTAFSEASNVIAPLSSHSHATASLLAADIPASLNNAPLPFSSSSSVLALGGGKAALEGVDRPETPSHITIATSVTTTTTAGGGDTGKGEGCGQSNRKNYGDDSYYYAPAAAASASASSEKDAMNGGDEDEGVVNGGGFRSQVKNINNNYQQQHYKNSGNVERKETYTRNSSRVIHRDDNNHSFDESKNGEVMQKAAGRRSNTGQKSTDDSETGGLSSSSLFAYDGDVDEDKEESDLNRDYYDEKRRIQRYTHIQLHMDDDEGEAVGLDEGGGEEEEGGRTTQHSPVHDDVDEGDCIAQEEENTTTQTSGKEVGATGGEQDSGSIRKSNSGRRNVSSPVSATAAAAAAVATAEQRLTHQSSSSSSGSRPPPIIIQSLPLPPLQQSNDNTLQNNGFTRFFPQPYKNESNNHNNHHHSNSGGSSGSSGSSGGGGDNGSGEDASAAGEESNGNNSSGGAGLNDEHAPPDDHYLTIGSQTDATLTMLGVALGALGSLQGAGGIGGIVNNAAEMRLLDETHKDILAYYSASKEQFMPTKAVHTMPHLDTVLTSSSTQVAPTTTTATTSISALVGNELPLSSEASASSPTTRTIPKYNTSAVSVNHTGITPQQQHVSLPPASSSFLSSSASSVPTSNTNDDALTAKVTTVVGSTTTTTTNISSGMISSGPNIITPSVTTIPGNTTIPTSSAADSTITMDGNTFRIPSLFGIVEDGVYRCGYPTPDTFSFLKRLQLRTVINLLDKLPEEYREFLDQQNIVYIHSAVKGNKVHCEEMDRSKVAAAIALIMDTSRYPLLIHCRSGKHRTGALIGCVRMLQRWTLERTCDEYVFYCKHKQRYVDKQYIERFDPRTLQSRAPPRERMAAWLPTDCMSHASMLSEALAQGEIRPEDYEYGLPVSAMTKGPDEPGVSYYHEYVIRAQQKKQQQQQQQLLQQQQQQQQGGGVHTPNSKSRSLSNGISSSAFGENASTEMMGGAVGGGVGNSPSASGGAYSPKSATNISNNHVHIPSASTIAYWNGIYTSGGGGGSGSSGGGGLNYNNSSIHSSSNNAAAPGSGSFNTTGYLSESPAGTGVDGAPPSATSVRSNNSSNATSNNVATNLLVSFGSGKTSAFNGNGGGTGITTPSPTAASSPAASVSASSSSAAAVAAAVAGTNLLSKLQQTAELYRVSKTSHGTILPGKSGESIFTPPRVTSSGGTSSSSAVAADIGTGVAAMTLPSAGRVMMMMPESHNNNNTTTTPATNNSSNAIVDYSTSSSSLSSMMQNTGLLGRISPILVGESGNSKRNGGAHSGGNKGVDDC